MVAAISELPYVDPIKKEKQVWKQRELFTEVPAKEAELVPEVAPLWLYIVSAVAGIVMLLLLIWLLSKVQYLYVYKKVINILLFFNINSIHTIDLQYEIRNNFCMTVQ